MRLDSTVVVRRSPEDVWAYLGDHKNVPAWDRGVESTRANPNTGPGVGFEFDTFKVANGTGSEAERGRMSYRVTEADPANGSVIKLINSDGNGRYFKEAEWRFQVHPVPEGALIVCAVHFKLRLRYMLLGPILFAMRGAIDRDLLSLKEALETG